MNDIWAILKLVVRLATGIVVFFTTISGTLNFFHEVFINHYFILVMIFKFKAHKNGNIIVAEISYSRYYYCTC